jgi:NADH:ubiquinone oxidoreductase subunit D
MATPQVHHGAMFDTNELVINMGPQHPSTHGVLRVVLRLDGEKVVDADVIIGLRATACGSARTPWTSAR